MERVLVTGGAGFIGSHLVDALVERGLQVRVVDNLLTGRLSNLDGVRDRIEFRQEDISYPAAAQAACAGVHTVFHVAALPSVPVSMERPADTHRHGDIATFGLLTAAASAGVQRFIYSSSSSVYGGEGPFPQRADLPPRPRSPYAATKVCGEVYVATFARAMGLDGISLRYFNIFGPRQAAGSGYAAVFPAVIGCLLRREPPTVYGDGKQTRDFTYVANAVHANLQAFASRQELGGAAVNIATGQRTRVLDLVAAVQESLGTDIAPRFVAPRPGDVRDSWADISHAERLIDYRPSVDLAEGLRTTLRWYQRSAASAD